MEGLSFDNVMTAEELFSSIESDDENVPGGEEQKEEPHGKIDNNAEEFQGNPFEDDDEDDTEKTPDRVGDDDKEDSGVSSSNKTSSSQKNNFSSIASTLKEFGTFEDLSDEDLASITDGESFIKAIDKQIKAKLDERQLRIDSALEAGVDIPVIKLYENILSNLDLITDETIKDESDKGSQLRSQLIYQDFINRGYSPERAKKEVTKSFNAGTDIEDAADALESNKLFYTDSYNKLVKEHNDAIEEDKKKKVKLAEDLKKSILDDEKAFSEFEVDKATRKKIYDNITKPVYRDPETKQQLSAIQKYAADNPADFQKYLGLVFTLTNNFKDFSSLIKGPVKKEMKQKIKEMENVINNSKTIGGGNPSLFGDSSDLDASFSNWTINF